MLEKRDQNYPTNPVYLTTFYREGVEKRKSLISLTEGVFRIYKSPLDGNQTDQIKLLKMRQYKNTEEKDTVITRFKSGIHSCMLLDIVKNLPDFLEIHNPANPYVYTHSDITVINNRLANVISFEQHPQNKESLYKGKIYIDNENDALLQVRFEINPAYVEKASSLFVERKSKGITIKTRHISYTVSYKYWDGVYYINHIRGDLHFNIRKKRQLFRTQLHTWFEMVNCGIEDKHVSRFGRKETIPQTFIFSETKHQYDASFWGNFNTILPEEELYEALSKITAKLEEINGE